jgi:hypothetical protein
VLGRLTSVAGAAVGDVGLVYVVGALSLSLRYEGFGLPGQQAAAVTPREVLLAAGLRTLLVWVALGVAVALALAASGARLARAIEHHVRTHRGRLAIVVIAIALIFARVLWPLAAVVAILATSYATVTWPAASARRVLVTALAIGLVAVAYEASRITYYVEWTCVGVNQPVGRACGVLIGQQDRGFYLGVPAGPDPARLLFLPAARVGNASTHKLLARVDRRHSKDRRTTIVSRLTDIRVR